MPALIVRPAPAFQRVLHVERVLRESGSEVSGTAISQVDTVVRVEPRRAIVDVEAVAVVDDPAPPASVLSLVDPLTGAAVVAVVDRLDVLAVDARL